MKRAALSLIGALLIGAPLLADADAAFQRLAAAKGLKCEFGPGTGAVWETGQLRLSSGSFTKDGERGSVHFDSINTKAGTARFIGNMGASDVKVTLDAVGLTFVEKPSAGGTVLTTVFGSSDGAKAYPAVHSKHVELTFTGPLPQQYYGTCRVWE